MSVWKQKDQENLWHPYTQHQHLPDLPVIVKAKGVYFYDEDGKSYLDGISSWWTCCFGHGHPELITALHQQMQELDHVLFGGFSHTPAIQLSEKLLQLLPDNQAKLFFSDNGSTAVEVAIKASLQFFINKGEKRTKILALEDAYHGDTFGAMAASGLGLFTEHFKDQLLEVVRIPLPTCDEVVKKAKDLLDTQEFAAFIFEPLVQGAAGMRMYDANFLSEIIQIAQNNRTFAIADEVMTGFGKTGKTIASNYLSVNPDIFCLSKALTGGMLPMAITSFTQTIYDGFLHNESCKALLHGHTFTANPLGCAAAIAAISLMEKQETQDQIQWIHQQHLQFQSEMQMHPKVENVRVMGVIFALDVISEDKEYYGNLRNKMYQFFIQNGLILRPIGNTIYLLPPYVILPTELEFMYEKVREVLTII
ncbi:MAG: adenosylmethionine--8-amino-7-oxononanoate transaminase [Flavobacterium sp.]